MIYLLMRKLSGRCEITICHAEAPTPTDAFRLFRNAILTTITNDKGNNQNFDHNQQSVTYKVGGLTAHIWVRHVRHYSEVM